MTVLVTTLICIRLLRVRKRHKKFCGDPGPAGVYTSVVALLTESYALCAAWYMMCFVILMVMRRPIPDQSYLALTESSGNIRVISVLLVVYRVVKGRAWGAQTEQQLSSLQWRHTATRSQPGELE
ncbi:hypothetical protein D9756_006818 [Leucocoprinus leucothites]|uniref:Uncharacterized protein n=1 Tax=Leucocoprinus leucothites TaxID=201217 RepID=A0A8H5G2H9_9AGAR|nr:hypothetical protein D9756_006818 [Leucoagaricus leucothites]